jgi:demethylmenaquinone methyltransferase/2-methoxy-6-polyprenyl-1,4-benzoquinol methylase
MVPEPAPREGARLGSGAMFDAIAGRYDLLNRLMSFGSDRRWRRQMVAALGLRAGDRVLDLATGTGDVALEILRQEPAAQVVGLDPSAAMLAVGRRKVAARGLDASITLLEGDAQAIPFPDGRFASTTIAFGIRNVPDRARALREMARVTRAGGRVGILELGEPRAWMARVHVHWAVPRLGALLSGSREYAYLQESMARFPPAEDFSRQLQESGLRVVSVTPFALGACHLFVAESHG